MKIKQLLFLCLLSSSIFYTSYAQNPSFAWAKAMGGPGTFDEGYSITTDNNGNVYTTGIFSGTIDFDPGAGVFNLTSAGSDDIFISKLDASGNFIWAVSMGGISSDAPSCIATDAAGNVYTTGYFDETVDFDPGAGVFNLTTSGFIDAFISKLDASGNFVWAKKMGGSGSDAAHSLALDAAGNIHIAGSFDGTADFNPGPAFFWLNSVAGLTDIFVVKLDASGNFVWAKAMGGINDDQPRGIALDANGNVHTVGIFSGPSADFDPGAGVFNIACNGEYDIFISKLDASGNFVWAKGIGASSWDWGSAIAVDANNDIYITGYFRGTVDFDPGAGTVNLVSAGLEDIYVGKLDASGNYLWAGRMGGTASDVGQSIALDAVGDPYTTGRFGSTADFDPGPGTNNLVASGLRDIFVSKLNANGTFSWAVKMGGSSGDVGFDITIASGCIIYTTGFFNWPSADFDPGPAVYDLPAVANGDIFISRLDGPIVLPVITAAPATICNGQNTSLTATGGTNYLWNTGSTSTTITVNPTANTIYSVTVNPGTTCAAIATQAILVDSVPAVLISGTTEICSGQNAILTATSGGDYLWDTGATSSAITVSPAASTPYSVTVTNSFGCSATAAQTITVNAIPTASVTGITTVCRGQNVSLTAGGGVSYEWSTGATTTVITLTPTANSTYSVVVTNGPGCTAAFIQNITVDNLPEPLITGDTLICQGENTNLIASGGTSYTWSINSTTSAITVSPTLNTVYSVTVFSGVCEATTNKTVVVNNLPVTSISKNTTISIGASAQLSAAGGTSYNWQPPDGLNCTTCPNPLASPQQTTVYYVTIADANGCAVTRSVEVLVECSEVFVPTAFSPNNDGQNDILYVKAQCVESFNFKIYNRWGILMFETEDVAVGWDGYYRGKLMNTDVFVYTFVGVGRNEEDIILQGNISLIR